MRQQTASALMPALIQLSLGVVNRFQESDQSLVQYLVSTKKFSSVLGEGWAPRYARNEQINGAPLLILATPMNEARLEELLFYITLP
jgi:hypothetical protein